MNSSQQLISIIMPMKNAAHWIEECLDSILNQSYSIWELIAVNDHSTDNTSTMLEGYSKIDGRIKLYQNSGNGIIDALNTALNYTRGDWITRMDADDIMPKDKLEVLVATLDWNEKVVATGKVKYFSSTRISQGYLEYEAWLNDRVTENDHWDWIYRECIVSSANWLAHRKNVNFEKNLYPEDYALTFYWFSNKVKILGSNQITHLWREHRQRTSRNSEDYQQASFFKLKINQFLKLTKVQERPLVVMGKNQKSQLTIELLKNQHVDYLHIHSENIDQFEKVDRPQVLIAVFPKDEEKRLIQELMTSKKLKMGQDWWWL